MGGATMTRGGCGAAGGGDNVAKDGRGCVIVGCVDMQYSSRRTEGEAAAAVGAEGGAASREAPSQIERPSLPSIH